jgi:hypothetical protein
VGICMPASANFIADLSTFKKPDSILSTVPFVYPCRLLSHHVYGITVSVYFLLLTDGSEWY